MCRSARERRHGRFRRTHRAHSNRLCHWTIVKYCDSFSIDLWRWSRTVDIDTWLGNCHGTPKAKICSGASAVIIVWWLFTIVNDYDQAPLISCHQPAPRCCRQPTSRCRNQLLLGRWWPTLDHRSWTLGARELAFPRVVHGKMSFLPFSFGY